MPQICVTYFLAGRCRCCDTGINVAPGITVAPLIKRGSLLGNEEIDLGGDLPFFELEY